MEMFKLNQKRESFCTDVKADWDKAKIDMAETTKEEKQVLETLEKVKKEQSKIVECQGSNYNEWTDCKGSYQANSGHKYDGFFKNGEIIKGISIYPGGAKYVGEFLNFIPHGYGTFVWSNGDKYFGQWKNGKSHGNGTRVWKDGRKYDG